ncbi:MAG: SDR family oxidoreductase [Mesorhizobium sp.]|nr:SDR family oxidoreductase [Mesorhizobium sp.]
MGLTGKTALVTAAGGPMGRAIAMRFAREGAALALADISLARLAETEAEIERLDPGCQIFCHRCDAAVEDQAEIMVESSTAKLGAIDIVVNVVGGIKDPRLYRPFEDITPARWEQTLAFNLMPGIHLLRKIVPVMRARAYGKIVNIASINFAGEQHSADYAAAKAAVASLTRTLAIEFAPDINVNCIVPGLIRTRVVNAMTADEVAFYAAKPLLRRVGEPEDIANAAFFLASEESSYITGEMLRVSGGVWPSL